VADASSPALSRGGLLVAAGVVLLGALLVFPVIFGLAMGRSLSHDEHQHLAAGMLVANEGLWPYRDFPYLHTPVLPLVYGLFLGHCEHLLLATRLFSTICASLIAGALFLAAFRAFSGMKPIVRIGLSALVPALLVTSPVVVFAAGRTSNHELSILFALLATFCQLAAIRDPDRVAPLFFSGLLLALAMGTRVTFAPLVAPFLASVFLLSSGKARIARVLAFAAGGVIGALPVLWLFHEAPSRFLYGVLQFSQTNLDYRGATGSPQNMTLPTKLRFFVKEIVVPNYAVFAAAFGTLIVFEWQRRRERIALPRELVFLLWLLPFLLAGSLAPSPAFEQYFFALIPFLLLVGIFCAARIHAGAFAARSTAAVCVVAIAASAIVAWPDYRSFRGIFSPQEWTPVRRHNEARELLNYPAEKILTLAPIHVLEAGLRIEPAFVTGPFAWRVADFVGASKRRRLGLVGAEDLESYLAAHPVDAILVGHEQRWESALVLYARRHGYRRVTMGDEEEAIWLKPAMPSREKKARPAR